MRTTTVIDEKEIIDLNNNLIFIRGKVFKKVNTSGMMTCITCCFHEVVDVAVPDDNEYYCNINEYYCNIMVIMDTNGTTGSLCYSKITNGDDISNLSFKEIRISLFVARLIWKSTRKSK